jgi:hypothetical protein
MGNRGILTLQQRLLKRRLVKHVRQQQAVVVSTTSELAIGAYTVPRFRSQKGNSG